MLYLPSASAIQVLLEYVPISLIVLTQLVSVINTLWFVHAIALPPVAAQNFAGCVGVDQTGAVRLPDDVITCPVVLSEGERPTRFRFVSPLPSPTNADAVTVPVWLVCT
jgi:hypothetical protein